MSAAEIQHYRLFFSITARPGSEHVLLLLVLRKVGQSLRAGSAAHRCLLDDSDLYSSNTLVSKDNRAGAH